MKNLYEGTVTVGELIKTLQAYDQDRIVILQKDAEGNSHSPFSDEWPGSYEASCTWAGEAGLEPEDLTEEMRKQGYGEEDLLPDGIPALMLVPVN